MNRDLLTDADAWNLASVIGSHLRRETLARPLPGEPEPAYTARAIQPLLRSALDQVEVTGLFLAGDGAGPIIPATFLDRRFYPDFAVMYFGQRVLAGEVKILRVRQSQNAVATAVGQVAIYRDAGYLAGVLCLVDLVNQFSEDAVRKATSELAEKSAVALVIRGVRSDALTPHLR